MPRTHVHTHTNRPACSANADRCGDSVTDFAAVFFMCSSAHRATGEDTCWHLWHRYTRNHLLLFSPTWSVQIRFSISPSISSYQHHFWGTRLGDGAQTPQHRRKTLTASSWRYSISMPLVTASLGLKVSQRMNMKQCIIKSA